MTGKIDRLMKEKGFGFIKGEDHNDYFFHQSALGNIKFDELTVGRDVTFEASEGPKGLRAEDVNA